MTRGEIRLAQVGREQRPVLILTRAEVIDVRDLVTVAEVVLGRRPCHRLLTGRLSWR